MADFTRDEVLQVVVDGRKCVGAGLRNIDLSDANLIWANLWGAGLDGADRTGVDLRQAKLYGANLRGADLRKADLTGAKLESADLRGARYSLNTTWPDGFDPQAAGAVLVD